MQWCVKPFNQLSTQELYAFLKLRIDVFVVEQTCYYPDLDNFDTHPDTLHIFAMEGDTCAAYLRILPPNTTYENMPSIGRVATSADNRGSGLGYQLLALGVTTLEKTWPKHTCHISAQSHLQHFYEKYHFVRLGEEYLEDNIPHIGMERLPQG
ncbi:GNAT family N-acetyltransferase [Flocculibacter collagenilyticus]|uniref:GNAT family N-acetyltransferase n=1 Tax=Flocculibacter collagenilyticus TaxID=2744479 RepID=UPI0018F5B8BB|nr:GNAT family N-acetyltransferase [Flocculibacter collagenilyticus]